MRPLPEPDQYRIAALLGTCLPMHALHVWPLDAGMPKPGTKCACGAVCSDVLRFDDEGAVVK